MNKCPKNEEFIVKAENDSARTCLTYLCPSGGMVDTTVSKAVAKACGFESHLRHHFMYTARFPNFTISRRIISTKRGNIYETDNSFP